MARERPVRTHTGGTSGFSVSWCGRGDTRVVQSVPPDSIPAVDDPTFSPGYEGSPDDDLIVIELATGSARGYPTRYLDFHEIVNDHVDDRPVAVTWCPLCGSAVMYEARAGDRTLTFGVSGKLADDNLVMYDRETGSEWKQSSGVCIDGEYEGTELQILPVAVTDFRSFEAAYPDGVILDPPGGQSVSSGADRDLGDIDYDEEPFGPYFESDAVGRDAFYDLIGRPADEHYRGPREWEREDLGAKEIVLSVDPEDPVAFPLARVRAEGGVVRTTVADVDLVVFATGRSLHAFDDPGFPFEPADGLSFRADGTTWDAVTGKSDDGRALDRLPGAVTFAFVWQDDHGPGSFYGTR